MPLDLSPDPVPLTRDGAGILRVAGTDVSFAAVVRAVRDGAAAEEIVRRYPAVDLASAYAVLAYYLRRRAAVDAYLAEEREGEAAAPDEAGRAAGAADANDVTTAAPIGWRADGRYAGAEEDDCINLWLGNVPGALRVEPPSIAARAPGYGGTRALRLPWVAGRASQRRYWRLLTARHLPGIRLRPAWERVVRHAVDTGAEPVLAAVAVGYPMPGARRLVVSVLRRLLVARLAERKLRYDASSLARVVEGRIALLRDLLVIHPGPPASSVRDAARALPARLNARLDDVVVLLAEHQRNERPTKTYVDLWAALRRWRPDLALPDPRTLLRWQSLSARRRCDALLAAAAARGLFDLEAESDGSPG